MTACEFQTEGARTYKAFADIARPNAIERERERESNSRLRSLSNDRDACVGKPVIMAEALRQVSRDDVVLDRIVADDDGNSLSATR